MIGIARGSAGVAYDQGVGKTVGEGGRRRGHIVLNIEGGFREEMRLEGVGGGKY